jgi:hypothetical protein
MISETALVGSARAQHDEHCIHSLQDIMACPNLVPGLRMDEETEAFCFLDVRANMSA